METAVRASSRPRNAAASPLYKAVLDHLETYLAERSRALEEVLPDAAYRQWVLVLPKRLRHFVHRDARRGARRGLLRERGRGVTLCREGRLGARPPRGDLDMRSMSTVRFAVLGLAAALAGCATPLMNAAREGDDARVKELLSRGTELDESLTGPTCGGTALACAAHEGKLSTVGLLLERGADPNRIVKYEGTPLFHAVTRGHADVVEALLAHGADPNGDHGMLGFGSYLDVADYYGHGDVARVLRAHGARSAMGEGSASGGSLAGAMAPSRGGSASSGGGLSGMLGGPAPRPRAGAGSASDSSLGGSAGPAPEEAAPPKPARIASDVDEPGYEKSPERPDDFALVVGISKYRDIPEAEFADRDAKAVKEHLLALGYPEENIITLLGDHATKGSLEEKLERWLPMNINDRSTVFVYYSGHGAPDAVSKEAYLVPWDGEPQALKDTALPLSRFYGDLQKLPAKRVLVALDSCFSGAGGRSVLAKGARPLVTKIDTDVPPGGKLVVFTASQADQISGTLEKQGHGAFTYYFLKGLGGEAASDSGRVTVGSLYAYLAKRVSAAAHRQEREQNPQLLPSVDAGGSIRLR